MLGGEVEAEDKEKDKQTGKAAAAACSASGRKERSRGLALGLVSNIRVMSITLVTGISYLSKRQRILGELYESAS